MGIKLLWKPIKRQIEETLDDLDELFEDVEKDADVAEKESSAEARVEINKISSHISSMLITLLNPSSVFMDASLITVF